MHVPVCVVVDVDMLEDNDDNDGDDDNDDNDDGIEVEEAGGELLGVVCETDDTL